MAVYDPKSVEVTSGRKRVVGFASREYVQVSEHPDVRRANIPLTYRRVIEGGLLGMPLSRQERRDLLEWMYLLGKSPDDDIEMLEREEWAVVSLVLFLRWGSLP